MLKFQDGKTAEVNFSYSESCKNVYKSFGVFIDGRKSNLTGLKRFLDHPDEIPSIIRANTYFWTPARNAGGRRANEKRHMDEVARWLKREGFSE